MGWDGGSILPTDIFLMVSSGLFRPPTNLLNMMVSLADLSLLCEGKGTTQLAWRQQMGESAEAAAGALCRGGNPPSSGRQHACCQKQAPLRRIIPQARPYCVAIG